MKKFELLPGVGELRKCSGFNPSEHFIPIQFAGSNESSLYLEVKWRIFWLHAYCAENQYQCALIEEPATMIGNYLQVVSKLYINDALVSQGVGGIQVDTQSTSAPYAIQQAATIAKGRALANAGFGTVFTAGSPNEDGGPEIPCDAGLRTSEFFKPVSIGDGDDELPFAVIDTGTQNQEPAKADAPAEVKVPKKRGPKPKAKEPSAAVTAPPSQPEQTVQPVKVNEPVKAEKEAVQAPTTRDEALRFKAPDGKYTGEMFGEIMAKDPNYIRWASRTDKYGEAFRIAAELVLKF